MIVAEIKCEERMKFVGEESYGLNHLKCLKVVTVKTHGINKKKNDLLEK